MAETQKRGTHGWAEVSRQRKQELIATIAAGTATRGPTHAELDLTDRCNVACYFCNQQDTRTRSQIPIAKARELIDELVATGLRSVRLSGGGDPLFHKEILELLDHLAAKQVVVDNLTTNGVALGREVAKRLVEHRAREVIVSLNAADAADYHRMMRVKPAHFEKVLGNVRHLIERRGEATFPSLVVQFLLDRQNFERMVEMYDLARALGPDRIAINAVLEVPRERIDRDRLLTPDDRERVRPLIEEVLRRDRDARLLQIDFAISGWNEMLGQARAATDYVPQNLYPTGSSFREENGGCFFAWYSTTITGNGHIHPCCLLIHPDHEPLGKVNGSSFSKQWNGPRYERMREEQLEVLLAGRRAEWEPGRFKILKEPCVKANLCWLKNMYFRADESFYQELGTALDTARERGHDRECRRAAAGGLKERLRSFLGRHPALGGPWDRLRNGTRPLRVWVARRTGLPVTKEL